ILESELEPICDPTYEISCFLHAALSRLESAGYEQEAAFTTLIHLTDTIIKPKNTELMQRVLNILRSQKIKILMKNRVLRIAIMKLQLASGDFDAGLKTLKSFRREQEPFNFSEVPQLVAIAFLIEQNDIEHANKIAMLTKEWAFLSNPP